MSPNCCHKFSNHSANLFFSLLNLPWSMSTQKWRHLITRPDEDSMSNKHDKDTDDHIIVNSEETSPIVILFGWAGCKDQNLRHYSYIYEKQGLTTIRYICPFNTLFFDINNMIRIGKEMVRPLEKETFLGSPIVFHIFSNGGAFQYEVFLKALEKHPLIKQIKGVIFDSTPGRRTMVSTFLAIKADVNPGYLQLPTSALLTLYCIMKGSLETINAKLLKKEYVQYKPFENLMDEEYKWPQHFIYSKADKLIPYQDVEEFIRYRESLGVDVSLTRYENSAHVQHYRNNKLSYVKSVVKFINKILKK
ncbi:hypothetical protein HHI36_021393 [Cryptolaemus montrouzieri]|uniref:Transmembrane protein 53 n=1 Tax=Cryptolaemus montrouzieri TaxID=559131 RepID=A0ABD2MWN4_9CUCU